MHQNQKKKQYSVYFNSSTIDKNPQDIRSAPSKSITGVAPSNRHTMHSVVVRKNLLKGVWNQVNQNHLLLNPVLCFEIKLAIKEKKSSKFAVQPIQVYLFEFYIYLFKSKITLISLIKKRPITVSKLKHYSSFGLLYVLASKVLHKPEGTKKIKATTFCQYS